jgi:acetolactate decarboxylase
VAGRLSLGELASPPIADHDVFDHRLVHALRVAALDRAHAHAEAQSGGLFQVSTVDALFAGDLEGDLTFAELAEHGDLGLGTLNGLDGEMIALDGRFLRADVDGHVTAVPPRARTPFAVVTRFRPTTDFTLGLPLDHDGFLAELDRRSPPVCALRIDGGFDHLRLRSVARQPAHTSLADAARAQHVFELDDVDGTLVGFRFPDYAQGLEVAGYHLHFVDAARERGGHVLECRPREIRVQLDPEGDLHVELPPGVELGAADASPQERARIREVEGKG